jgi:hypothetical protein
MVTVITSPAISLQTFNTTPVGGDAQADVDDASHSTHTNDSSDQTTTIRADNGGTEEVKTLMRIVLPSEEEMIDRCLNGTYTRMTKIPEGGLNLTGMSLFLSRTDAVGVTVSLRVFELKEDFSENECTWDSPNGNGTEDWTPGFADSTKVYKNPIGYFNISSGDSAQKEFVLDGLVKLNEMTWGDRVLLYMHVNQATNDFTIGTPNHSTSARRPVYKLDFTCNPPIPKITVTPDTNGIDGLINITTPRGDAFLADGQYHVAWNTSATIAYNQASKSTTFTDTGLTQINTNQIAGALLGADDTDYYISVFAEDGISTASNSGQSNVVNIERPECTAALDDYSPDVGQEVTLTITPSDGMFGGKVKQFGVNWDSGTSDLDSDYSWYTLDTASSDAYTIKHKFHKVANFAVKARVKDELGWSSDHVATGTATTSVNEPTPIANLSLSREKVLQAKYLDRTTVMTASLAKSKAIGSNRELTHYWFRYVPAIATTVCTSGAINNDNSVFDNNSSRVSFQTLDKAADYSDTSVQIYGQASFQSDGTPIADTNAAFDHYKYVTEKLFCPDTRLTEGSAKSGEAGEADKGVSFYFYKSVEIVVCTAVDSDDSGTSFFTRYILKKYSSDDSDTPVINASIRPVAKTGDSNFENLYSWSNFARVTDGSCSFVASGNYIQSGTDDWYDLGFYVGDIIKVKDGNGTNGSYASPKYFKIKSFAASSGSGAGATYNRAVVETDSTLLTSHEKSYVTTSIADSAAATSEIVLDNSDVPSVTFATYNSTGADDTVTIYGRVADSDETFFVLNESAEVTQTFRAAVPMTLDLDTLVDNSHIAILNSNIARSGGISAQMPLGERKYPIGVVRTKVGSPKLSLSLRILSQTGLSNISNIIEGDVYDYVFLDSDKIDTPTAAFKSYRLRAEGGNLSQDPSSATQYLANIEFSILGEELAVE